MADGLQAPAREAGDSESVWEWYQLRHIPFVTILSHAS
jgi:hypothetical protein